MSKNTKEVEIKVDGKKWEEANEKAYKKLSKKAKIAGFRPGHVPKNVFLKHYGEESIYAEAAEGAIDAAYAEAIKKVDLDKLVARPEVNIKSIDASGVTYTFVFTMKPEVKLGEYKNLGVKKQSIKVTKNEIADEIKKMQEHYSESVVKEGKLESGDTAIIDFEGFMNGVAFDGGKGENYSLKIGSNTFIPGFEDKLIGMKKGETKDIELTFPKDYHASDLKGKDVVFKVTLNEIKTTVIPDINDEFFEDLGMEGVNSRETLEEEVKKTISARKESDAENKYIDDLLEAAANNMKVDIPEVMIDEEAHRMVHEYGENLRMQGISLEQFYQFTNSSEEELKSKMHDEAEKRVKYRLMLEEIAKTEKIEISDDEANEEADKLSKRYNMTRDEFIKLFGGLDMVKYDAKMRRAIETLKGE